MNHTVVSDLSVLHPFTASLLPLICIFSCAAASFYFGRRTRSIGIYLTCSQLVFIVCILIQIIAAAVQAPHSEPTILELVILNLRAISIGVVVGLLLSMRYVIKDKKN